MVAHVQGTVIDPNARGLGLYRELNRFRFEQILDELVGQDRIMSWALETDVLPGSCGQLLAANQPDITGSPFNHLDLNAADACNNGGNSHRQGSAQRRRVRQRPGP